MPRPHIHFTSQNGWINDPHGLTWHEGRYHLFHQHVPGRTTWAPNCHWGHAVGTDLLTWQHRPFALAPGDGDDGIWTGSLVHFPDGPRIYYTSVRQPELGLGRVRVATPSDPALDAWEKGPVVVDCPEDSDIIAFRDPFIRREAGRWRMFVGAGRLDGRAQALTWVSDDGWQWVSDGVALERSTSDRAPVWMGALWECPQFAELDGGSVMVSSIWDDDVLHHAGYAVGEYRDGRFAAHGWGQLSHGTSYYAPSMFTDATGATCLIFWMRGVLDEGAGWGSCLSLPYVLTVRDGRAVVDLHPTVAEHRGDEVGPGALAGCCAHDLVWNPTGAGERVVLGSSGDPVATVTAEDGSLALLTPAGTQRVPWDGLEVRIVIDSGVLEMVSAGRLIGGPLPTPDEVKGSALRVWQVRP